jgi:hypothetical protein
MGTQKLLVTDPPESALTLVSLICCIGLINGDYNPPRYTELTAPSFLFKGSHLLGNETSFLLAPPALSLRLPSMIMRSLDRDSFLA